MNIKFRGQTIKNKEWQYGYYIKHQKTQLNAIFNGTKEEWQKKVEENEEHWIVFDGPADWNLPKPMYRADVIGSTICQSTGLSDKNNTEIYTDDIIETDGYIGVIKLGQYSNHQQEYHLGFYIDWINDKYSSIRQDLVYWVNKGLEIIGNIHDNPEFLNKG